MRKNLIYRRPASHPAEQPQIPCCIEGRQFRKVPRVIYLWRAKDSVPCAVSAKGLSAVPQSGAESFFRLIAPG